MPPKPALINRILPSAARALPALAMCGLLPPSASAASPEAARPNVLFIAVDDLRPAIGAYGDALAITPNIDGLAKSGALFQKAYCQQAICHASRASLLSGTRPDTTRIYDLSTPLRKRLPNVVTLPQLFRQNGYFVLGRGKIFHSFTMEDAPSWDSPPQSGKPLDGTMYALPENKASAAKASYEKGIKNGPAFERAAVPDNAYTDGILAEEAVGELKSLKAKGEPFFFALGFIKPHLPFCAPEKYWAMHDREKLWPPPNRKLPEGTPSWVSQPGWELRAQYDGPTDQKVAWNENFQKDLRHGYYAAASYVDAQIGKVLDALRTEGLDQNTIVVLWGDHGYHVGDHGTWCKHTNFEEAVRVPLIIRAPGYPAGENIPAPVESLDVYPTLVALCHLAPPPQLEGESLVPLLKDPESQSTKGYAFSQYPRGGGKEPLMGYSVRKGPWRYTEWIATKTGTVKFRELYNLESDPTVTKNMAEAEPATVKELSAVLVHAGKGVPSARAKAQ